MDINPLQYSDLVEATARGCAYPSMDIDDRIQEAWVALLEAIPKKGKDATFPGYAKIRIQYALKDIVRHYCFIYVPATSRLAKHTSELADKAFDMQRDHCLDELLCSEDDYDDDFIIKVLNLLTDHQANIIYLRYGLDGGPLRGFAEVGHILGIPACDVFLSEKRALKRIRKGLANAAIPKYGKGEDL